MLDDFDKLMIETGPRPNESPLKNPPIIATTPSPIITITCQEQIDPPQALVIGVDNDYSLPP